MLAWSRKAADLAALAGSVREKAEAVARREEQRSHHRRELIDALGEPTPVESDALADLVDGAQELIDAVAKESKAREKLKDELETLNGDRPARVEAAESSQAAWDHWQGAGPRP